MGNEVPTIAHKVVAAPVTILSEVPTIAHKVAEAPVTILSEVPTIAHKVAVAPVTILSTMAGCDLSLSPIQSKDCSLVIGTTRATEREIEFLKHDCKEKIRIDRFWLSCNKEKFLSVTPQDFNAFRSLADDLDFVDEAKSGKSIMTYMRDQYLIIEFWSGFLVNKKIHVVVTQLNTQIRGYLSQEQITELTESLFQEMNNQAANFAIQN